MLTILFTAMDPKAILFTAMDPEAISFRWMERSRKYWSKPNQWNRHTDFYISVSLMESSHRLFCFIRFRFLFMGHRANLTIRIYQPKNTEYIRLTLKAQQILKINEVMRFVRTGHVAALQTSTFWPSADVDAQEWNKLIFIYIDPYYFRAQNLKILII